MGATQCVGLIARIRISKLAPASYNILSELWKDTIATHAPFPPHWQEWRTLLASSNLVENPLSLIGPPTYRTMRTKWAATPQYFRPWGDIPFSSASTWPTFRGSHEQAMARSNIDISRPAVP